MKKFLLVALIFVISCNGKENKVDSAVNREISEKFNSIPTLWQKTEAHFFQRIADLGLMENQDSTEAFVTTQVSLSKIATIQFFTQKDC